MINRGDIDRNQFRLWTPSGNGRVLQDHADFDDHIVSPREWSYGCGATLAGTITNPAWFSRNLPEMKIEVFPIKQAGSDHYKLPEQYGIADTLSGLLDVAAEDQHARCPLATMKHAVAVLRATHVVDNGSQIAPQWHCDDIVNACLYNSFPTDSCGRPARDMSVHAYIASNFAGTQVQTAPVPNAGFVFDDQAGFGDKELQAQFSRAADPFEVMLMNSKTYHRPNALCPAWKQAARKDPVFADALDDTGGWKVFAGILYIPTEAMRPLLGRHQKIRSKLVF